MFCVIAVFLLPYFCVSFSIVLNGIFSFFGVHFFVFLFCYCSPCRLCNIAYDCSESHGHFLLLNGFTRAFFMTSCVGRACTLPQAHTKERVCECLNVFQAGICLETPSEATRSTMMGHMSRKLLSAFSDCCAKILRKR